jgi:hypothetical protein
MNKNSFTSKINPYILNDNRNYIPIDNSEDIILTELTINNLIITATVHRTDTVTVVVKCSRDQVILSTKGISRLDDALSLLEAQVKIKIDQSKNGGNHHNHITVPPRAEWIVTLWHFAIDCYSYYSGQRFFCSWKVGRAVLISIYSKWWPNDKFRIRVERQESPEITIANALDEKLGQVKSSRSV